MQTLKRKIQHLENLHRRKKSRLSEDAGTEPGTAPSPSARSAPPNQPAEDTQIAASTSQEPLKETLEVELGRFALGAMSADGRIDEERTSLPLSTHHFIKVTTDPQYGSLECPQYVAQPLSLRRDGTLAWLRKYQAVFLRMYPFMDKAALQEDYEYVLQQHESSTTVEITSGESARFFIVYVAIATAAASATGSSDTSFFASQLYKSALSLTPKLFTQGEHPSTLRCLIALAVHAGHTQGALPVRRLIGIAMDKAIAMGLHRAKRSEESYDHRSFWVLYLMDRQAAVPLSLLY